MSCGLACVQLQHLFRLQLLRESPLPVHLLSMRSRLRFSLRSLFGQARVQGESRFLLLRRAPRLPLMPAFHSPPPRLPLPACRVILLRVFRRRRARAEPPVALGGTLRRAMHRRAGTPRARRRHSRRRHFPIERCVLSPHREFRLPAKSESVCFEPAREFSLPAKPEPTRLQRVCNAFATRNTPSP